MQIKVTIKTKIGSTLPAVFDNKEDAESKLIQFCKK